MSVDEHSVPQPSSEAAREGGASLHVQIAPKINYACYQNDVPVLRELVVRNDADRTFCDLRVEMTAEPEFVASRCWHISRIDPGQRRHVEDLQVSVDGGVLWELTEAVAASLRFRLCAGEEELAGVEQRIELLAKNEWSGLASMPEMIAAFVMPNDPAVDTILGQAAEVLRRSGCEPSLDGYETGDPRRVVEQVAALWSVLQARRLGYALPPASFQTQGQKVRSPSRVLQAGVGTCLDLSVLLAACLEQCRLHPLIVFYDGHAFVGCWTVSEQFQSVLVDDVTSLRKRMKLGELLFFETTLLVGSQPAPFRAACETAEQRLAPWHDDAFLLAVDVHRARLERIQPLAEQVPEDGPQPIPALDLPAARLSTEELPELNETAMVPGRGGQGAQRDRLEHWKNRLLDLSLRNRLLNFRETRRTIRIRCSRPEEVEDRLARGEALSLVSGHEVMFGATERSEDLHRRRTGEDLQRIREAETLERRQLLVDLPRDELERRLVELYRATRSSLQEGGVNTLYLAVGFLAWTRPGEAGRRFLAPLILVPVSLQRRSVRTGFRLQAYDEDPCINPTLLQMLKQDFGLQLPALAEPPADDAGLDVERIYRTFTSAIRDQPGWEVVPDVVLATFSFAKYLMWADLNDRPEQLKQNDLVRHLVETPNDPYGASATFPDAAELDRRYPPERTNTILSYDSSQLAAILAAAEGRDFVLIGPPGTGKSQTIANMIAQCLAEGRRVLFVAEKIAALEVVARRLKQAGLGEFCLELHSHKARKAAVLEQLRRAWEATDGTPPQEWAEQATRLKDLRDELNVFVERLHRHHPNGLSVYEAIGRAVRYAAVPQLQFAWSHDADHTADRLERWRDLAQRLGPAWADVPQQAAAALANVAVKQWSPQWQQEFVDGTSRLRDAAAALQTALGRFCEACGLERPESDAGGVRALIGLADVFSDIPDIDASFLVGPGASKQARRLERAARLVAERAATLTALSQPYRLEQAQSADLPYWRRLWDSARHANLLVRWWRRWRVRRALRRLTETGLVPDCEHDLPLLEKLQELERHRSDFDELSACGKDTWRGWDSDPQLLQTLAQCSTQLQQVVPRLARSATRQQGVLDALRRTLSLGHAGFGPTSAVGVAADEVARCARTFDAVLEQQARRAATSAERLFDGNDGDWLEHIQAVCTQWGTWANALRPWCHWQRLADELRAEGLGPLVEAVRDGRIEATSAPEVLEVNYCRWWSNLAIGRDELLRSFSSPEREHLITRFRKADARWLELTRQFVRAKLCSAHPRRDTVARSGQWGVLSREIRKKRRHKPIRQLFAEAADAVLTLAPCVMMSPLSVAQYLEPEQQLFDVVIFDEASQIPPWDAIGSLARARRAVIVGDPRQLPPTSFFTRTVESDADAEGADIEEDLESILDECLAANVPARELLWHYRSRHESLIAFSNHRYYDGKLVTFPSAAVEDRAVRCVPVPHGVYERGGARINRAEAEAVVEHIVQRLRDPEFARKGLSIGVVTFNLQQQTLIEDLLDDARRRFPEIERWFSDEVDEPVFVKNLESVQGDERDIICFSVTYGPDAHGHVTMNFGPLNNQGGQRRLNVAITRARSELLVFATLKSEQIDLRRTQAAGVRDFKHFLEFAECGASALDAFAEGRAPGGASEFVAAVAEALRERGWDVRQRIGVSAFRLDLAVAHPTDRGRFLAGIECDGPTYRDSATARDRDILRQQVLHRLGWRLLRVWSIDWWANPQGTADRLDRQLRKLLEED